MMTATHVITDSDIHQAVRDAVQLYGTGWVNPHIPPTPYTYTVDGVTHHDLIAETLLRLGFDIDGLSVDPRIFIALEDATLLHRFTDNAVTLLTSAQMMQDVGTPWGIIADRLARFLRD